MGELLKEERTVCEYAPHNCECVQRRHSSQRTIVGEYRYAACSGIPRDERIATVQPQQSEVIEFSRTSTLPPCLFTIDTFRIVPSKFLCAAVADDDGSITETRCSTDPVKLIGLLTIENANIYLWRFRKLPNMLLLVWEGIFDNTDPRAIPYCETGATGTALLNAVDLSGAQSKNENGRGDMKAWTVPRWCPDHASLPNDTAIELHATT